MKPSYHPFNLVKAGYMINYSPLLFSLYIAYIAYIELWHVSIFKDEIEIAPVEMGLKYIIIPEGTLHMNHHVSHTFCAYTIASSINHINT